MSFVTTPPPSVIVEHANDGSIRLRSGLSHPPARQSLPHLFDEVAARRPATAFMRQRDENGEWRGINYAQARRAADGLAQWLIDQGLDFGDSVSYLSEPSIEHGIAAIGIQRSGAAIAPISVAYSLNSDDFTRLRSCVAVVGAKVIIVGDASRYAKAMRALADFGAIFVTIKGEAEGVSSVRWADVIATEPTPAVAERMARITHASIARIMYTSGSTGSPKATPQSQANMTVTVAQTETVGLLNFDGEPPQFLEAMPFSHIMAGNFNFNNVIAAGGTIWIDEGKPTAQLFHHTIANLHEVSPHFFLTVPLGFAMLCDAMEADPVLRDKFFSNLRYLGSGGATLPEQVRERLVTLSRIACGAVVPIFTFYGATEYLFGALRYWSHGSQGVIGLPLPGVELKLIERGDRMELRVRSPAMMPASGYIGAPEASRELFDAEGFFRTGDAVRFEDETDAAKGLVFAGRLSEDFKLSSGTYVNVSALRQDLLAALAPLATELVLCGLNEDYVGALIWPSGEHDRLSIERKIAAFNENRPGASRRIGAALLVDQPLSFAAGELTDKGNLAARIVLQRRAAAVARLYADRPDCDVILFRQVAAAAHLFKE